MPTLDASLNDVRAATDPDLKSFEKVVVSGRRWTATVATWHPPSTFQRASKARIIQRMVSHHRLVEVAHHIEDAERAHALWARVRGLTIVTKDLPDRRLTYQILAVLIADRLAREPVWVRPHLLTLTGEIPLAFGA